MGCQKTAWNRKTGTVVGLIGAFIASRPNLEGCTGGPPSITGKISLCAPSNAAADEVAKRLKEGVRSAQGELIIPRLVWIGAELKVNMAVKDIFLDELVEAMSQNSEPGKAAQSVRGAAGAIQDLGSNSANWATLETESKWKQSDCPQKHPSIGCYKMK
ncbi:hypothetical protein PCASD_22784 [Puccinia coronata f. sp. avenae]|uniref:DNA2/NAM7 helicase helicase domain-containing protein n=1 Tax=Puccinia coronata f. sp. avenae TaxID=200324 RepID=A0A2N5TJ59_9BASI|nr:hypothetical protein PCASD_22784 [Puccinia coronata f. sp. avenae]